MTNNTNTIRLDNTTHGTFIVTPEGLSSTTWLWGHASLDFLHKMIHDAVGIEVDFAGQGSYSDLDRASALVVLTYLTGGAAD